jgi:acetyltransferase-like isoleucine patch superfamily enzyme
MTTTKRFTIVGRSKVHPTAKISDGVIVGKRFRPLLDGTREASRTTIIGAHTYIGYYSIIGAGSTIRRESIIDDFILIESGVIIDRKSLVIYRAQICNDVEIGSECVIGGFVGERTRIGNRCRIFGRIVHLQHEPQKGWDAEDVVEPAATIEDSAFVAFGAVISGPVTIGRKAYVCSGAVVTKDVPPKHVVRGVNKIVPFSKWPGRLKQSPFFRD